MINFRGCAGVPVTSPLFYSAAHTNDTRQALRYIAQLYPDALILGVGFSLGANVLIRYLGEEREQSRIHAACALGCVRFLISSPILATMLIVSSISSHGIYKRTARGVYFIACTCIVLNVFFARLQSSFLGSHIYSKAMGKNLLRLLKRHAPFFEKTPDHYVAIACQEALKLDNPSLFQFDDTFTRVAGGPQPDFPFRNGEEYYIFGSSDKLLSQVTVPLLTINAKDDPIVRNVPTENNENGNVVMVLTRHGGHLGWFQSGSANRWTTEPVLEWLKVMAEEVLHEPKQRGPLIYVDDEGFLRDKGREQLGCKQIEGGGLIDGNGGVEGILQGL